MSCNFASDSGFCACGNELLTFFELSDGECSTCAVAAENEEIGSTLMAHEAYCVDAYADFDGAFRPRDW